MVAMPQPTRRQVSPRGVELRVGRGQHDRLWSGEAKYQSRERVQPGWIEVLYHFDRGGSIETLDAAVAIRQRAVQQLDPRPLAIRGTLEMQLLTRGLGRAIGHIQADDLGELTFSAQQAQEVPFAAAQIEHPRRARGLQLLDNGRESNIVEPQRSFDGGFLGVAGD